MDKNPNRNGTSRNATHSNRPQGAPHPAQRPRGHAPEREAAPRTRIPAKRKNGNRAKRTVFLSIGAVAAVFVIFVLFSFFIGVRSIEVVGAELCTREEIIVSSEITEGSGYFSYNTAKSEKKILESIPCVESVEISRSIFGTVTISVTEKNAYWYTELFGEYFVLSDELEIIRHMSGKAELLARGLVRLDFPKVESAVIGRRIEISDDGRDCSFVDEFLAEVRESELYKEGRLYGINIKTKFEISAVCDMRYKIVLGKYSEAALKLNTAKRTIEDDKFAGEEKGILDVSALPNVVTRSDSTLDFSYLAP